jgi:hypothetical protein
MFLNFVYGLMGHPFDFIFHIYSYINFNNKKEIF